MATIMHRNIEAGSGAPIRVAYDHRIFAQQVHGGISFYFARLISALAGMGIAPTIVAPVHINRHITELPDSVVRGVAVRGGRVALAFGKRAGNLLGPAAARAWPVDLHHESYYGQRRLMSRRVPVVTTVHDMIQELHPEQFAGDPTLAAKRASIERAERIICISQNTRDDLLRFYPQVEAKCVVVHHGVDPVAQAAETTPPARPFLLFVGNRGGYKNFAGLLAAYAASPALRDAVEIVCVGPSVGKARTIL